MLRLDASWSPMSTPVLMEKGSPSSGAAGSGSDRRYAGESVVLEELRVDGDGGSMPEKKVRPWSLPGRTFIASNFINTTQYV